MYYAPKVVFDRIMAADDIPEDIPASGFPATIEVAKPELPTHDHPDPDQCSACLARGGGDIS